MNGQHNKKEGILFRHLHVFSKGITCLKAHLYTGKITSRASRAIDIGGIPVLTLIKVGLVSVEQILHASIYF